VAHLGWDVNNKGLELDSVDLQLQQFFNNAGVSEYELQDKGTRKFIYDFIERNGGMSAVQEDIRPLVNAKNSNQPPALPERQEYPPPIPARTIPVSLIHRSLYINYNLLMERLQFAQIMIKLRNSSTLFSAACVIGCI